jgi:hypothetical protein
MLLAGFACNLLAASAAEAAVLLGFLYSQAMPLLL